MRRMELSFEEDEDAYVQMDTQDGIDEIIEAGWLRHAVFCVLK